MHLYVFIDVVFRPEDTDLAYYASLLHLNLNRFIRDVLQGAYRDRIHEDFRSGVRSGVNGTPTFFINGLRYDGPRDLESMAAALNNGTHSPRYEQ